MRKTLSVIVVCACCLIGQVVDAQIVKLPKVLGFANVTYANPSNADFKNVSNHGLGYEIGAGIGLGKTLLMGSVGRMSYNIPNALVVNGTTVSTSDHLKVTPLKIGLRQYLIAGLFLNGNVGVAMQKYDKYSATASNFLWEAGAGFKFGFLELAAAYTGYKMAGTSINANSLLLKGGIAIKL